MRAYSLDLRERVLADVDAGLGKEAVARKYRVSSRWVYKLHRQRSETGQIAPRRGPTGPKPKLASHTERLVQLVGWVVRPAATHQRPASPSDGLLLRGEPILPNCHGHRARRGKRCGTFSHSPRPTTLRAVPVAALW